MTIPRNVNLCACEGVPVRVRVNVYMRVCAQVCARMCGCACMCLRACVYACAREYVSAICVVAVVVDVDCLCWR